MVSIRWTSLKNLVLAYFEPEQTATLNVYDN
ncbi:hypothetical protein HDF26_002144 [Pedobacter cryoconitis]|uniref:Uncharacterized protein n=1 Tax=Pedobacter cryoconitis TaxID=188932 RepID=A0A7W8ZJD2_9SPHI|nr:hypothetical protein [Pedobacter cryoconitis]MBB6271687.1 hypothetical protein [Pedobacter cryoconitis]